MAIEIESPPRGEGSVREQLQALQSYLHRTSQQLKWAFETLEAGKGGEISLPENLPRSQSPREIFAGIKSLIIRSADIVDAYDQQIRKRLEGEYTASSEFGSFRQQTTQQLEANSRELKQLFLSEETLLSQVEGLERESRNTAAYLRSGKLEEGEFPVYGLEIGQTNTHNGQQVFKKFARFTPDRLSFFDGSSVEVAYISDFRLFITDASVAGTLSLGGRFQTSFENGLIFKWTGGNS